MEQHEKQGIMQVHIEDDREYERVLGYEVEVDEYEYRQTSSRVILLSRGGDIEGSGELFTIQMKGAHQRMVITDPKTAVAYFLHMCESHGISEDHVLGDTWDEGSEIMEEYVEWIGTLSERDRRLRLMDLADYRIERGDFAAGKYLDEGATWRSTNLTESGKRVAKEMSRTIDIKPKLCYYTAQKAALKHLGNHRVSYVEGLCIPKNPGQCIRHAWVEVDDEVVELTWPWHWFDGKEAQYFGIEFSKEEVQEARERRDVNGALVLTDDEVRKIGSKMASQ